MSWVNLAIIVVAFVVFYRYVVPLLFPGVVSGTQKLKADADLAGGGKEYIVQHGNMGLFGAAGAAGAGADKRSHLRARRRANAADASTV